MSDCQHRWYRNFMLINTKNVLVSMPQAIAAEHLCVDCGTREWEVLTEEEWEKRRVHHYPAPASWLKAVDS